MRSERLDFCIKTAILASERSTCNRRKVGAVLEIKGAEGLFYGFNGSMPGSEHCTDAGCLLDKDGRCIRTIHAEVNAIIKAGSMCAGGALYTTCFPCWNCYKLIRRVGIESVYFIEEYHGEEAKRVCSDISDTENHRGHFSISKVEKNPNGVYVSSPYSTSMIIDRIVHE